jgi:CPA2 family monovalent cation:H+ antiporter-2
MSDHQFLLDLLILLALALASALVFTRLRLSPIIGYLVSGMIAGPYGLHLIKNLSEVETIAEFGVILLLFTIGLEFSVSRLLRLKHLLLAGGLAQMLLCGAVFTGLAALFGFEVRTAVTLAMALALSSTAIVLKLLSEHGEIDTAHGRMSLGILLAQDLAVVFFLVGLPLLGGLDMSFSLWNIAKVALLLGGLLIFSRYALQPLLLGILKSRSQELFRITILALVLVTAWLTGTVGLSLELGAFLAGLALAESPYAHQALSDILPFRDTFLAIFFVTIGMLVNLELVTTQWPVVLGATLIVVLVKFMAAALATLVCRYPLRIALLSGLLLFQAGEFSFVVLKEATDLALLPDNAYQVVLAVIALTMIATPLVAGQAHSLAAWISALFGHKGGVHPELQERTANLSGHVLIAGYGLSGRNVGQILRRFDIPFLYVELNADSVSRGRRNGEFIVYGDITSREVLHELGIERARALVLAINDPASLARGISIARQCNPDLFILARTRYVAEREHLLTLGADQVIPDEFEASLQLGANLMRRFHINEGRIMHVLSELRQQHYASLLQAETPVHGVSILEGGRMDYQAVPDDSACIGRSLAEIDLRNRTGVTVIGVIRQERTIYSPAGSFRIEQGDTLMLLGSSEDMVRSGSILHGHEL